MVMLNETHSLADWQIAHGTLLIILIGCALATPLLRHWPWIWLAPLAAYSAIAVCISPLRRSLHWLRFGRISAATVGATLAIIVLTTVTLLGFHAIAQPDIRPYWDSLPLDVLGGVILAGILFSVVNATLEEFVFRGVIFDALASQYSVWFTVAVTAALFGLGHLRGYPSGLVGACLAGTFGLLMGLLRVWTAGLALPIAAHIAADATIYLILLRSQSS